MEPNGDNLERVGRWLDGEQIELTPSERALADEIAADADTVGRALEVPLPGGTLHRANARLKRALAARRRRPWLRWASAAAAAAAVVAALVFSRARPGIEPSVYVESFLEAPAGELDARVQILAEELADYQIELTLGNQWPVEVALNGLEQEVDDILLGDPDPARQSLWEEQEDSL